MPASLKLKVLKLDVRDLRKATEEAEERKRDAERKRRTIKLAGEDIVVGETNYSDIAERVATLVAENEQLLETPTNVRSVIPIETGGHRARGRGKGTRKGSGRPSMTDEQRSAIGFIGEQIAFEWLKKQFGQAVSEACWVSGNRDLAFGTDDGDDSLGYDFEVSEGARTLYYEVKATSGTETVIELGPSEIRAAERYRSDRRRQFRIIFISEALDPGNSCLYVLPNPSSKSGKRYFRAFPKSSVRFEFSLKY